MTFLASATTSTLSMAHFLFPLALALVLLLTPFQPVEAAIGCVSPQGTTYQANDTAVLSWNSDSALPTIADINTISAILYCDTGSVIANINLGNNTAGPFNYTIPSVGNATTVGGNMGNCTNNLFHIEYSGTYWGFAHLLTSPFGPVRCASFTINPAPNVTSTTTTMSSTSTSSSSTKTKPSATPTQTNNDTNSSGPAISAPVIATLAVVAFLVLVLVAVGSVCYLRKKKRERMESALVPWASQPPAGFSKITSTDDHSDSTKMTHTAAAGAAAAGVGAVAGAYSSKPQPRLPGDGAQNSNYQQLSNQGGYGGYEQQQYDAYGYPQQQPGQPYNRNPYQHQQQPYDGEDSYYNPYYGASSAGQSNPSFYTNPTSPSMYGGPVSTPGFNNNLKAPYMDSPQMGGAGGGYQHQAGYFPPPPPMGSSIGNGSTSALVPLPSTTVSSPQSGNGAPQMGSALTSIPVSDSSSSSPKRGPQGIKEEMGRPEPEPEAFPMTDMKTSP